jgi:hypothetical protein
MSVSRRRERNSLVEPRQVALIVEDASNNRLTELARAAGTSRSAVFQWLVDTVAIDPQGVPAGWPQAHPNQAPLPVNAA